MGNLEMIASGDQIPSWSHRCTWRDELDVRAGQLERISLQFDATKRSLDAANEELQWHATSAEALRLRLSDVMRAVEAEEVKTSALHSEYQQSEVVVKSLLLSWNVPVDAEPENDEIPRCAGQRDLDDPVDDVPLLCKQAQWVLDRFAASPEF